MIFNGRRNQCGFKSYFIPKDESKSAVNCRDVWVDVHHNDSMWAGPSSRHRATKNTIQANYWNQAWRFMCIKKDSFMPRQWSSMVKWQPLGLRISRYEKFPLKLRRMPFVYNEQFAKKSEGGIRKMIWKVLLLMKNAEKQDRWKRDLNKSSLGCSLRYYRIRGRRSGPNHWTDMRTWNKSCPDISEERWISHCDLGFNCSRMAKAWAYAFRAQLK